jgi:hypothetical protein
VGVVTVPVAVAVAVAGVMSMAQTFKC